MTFDTSVSWTLIVSVVLSAAGGLMWIWQANATAKSAAEKASALDVSHDKLRDAMAELKLEVARDYVMRVDLRDALKETENRLGKQIEEVGHTFRNEQAKSIKDMTDMVKTLLERALGVRS